MTEEELSKIKEGDIVLVRCVVTERTRSGGVIVVNTDDDDTTEIYVEAKAVVSKLARPLRVGDRCRFKYSSYEVDLLKQFKDKSWLVVFDDESYSREREDELVLVED